MDAKKQTQCPFCKEEIRADAVKCKHCQSAVRPSTPAHEGVCPFCKEEIRKDAVKCKHCHSNLLAGGCGCSGGEGSQGGQGGQGVIRALLDDFPSSGLGWLGIENGITGYDKPFDVTDPPMPPSFPPPSDCFIRELPGWGFVRTGNGYQRVYGRRRELCCRDLRGAWRCVPIQGDAPNLPTL